MAATGLEVFDRTVQTTNIWLDEIMKTIGPDRHAAWHALGAVLHALRDRLPLELAVHLGAQLPLLVRGLYYDQWHVARQPEKLRSLDEFLQRVAEGLRGTRPMDVRDATLAVLRTLAHHVDPGQVHKVAEALPGEIREFWRKGERAAAPRGGAGA
ncbi:DUF2267 domain-containing protein [Caldovatus aquaticus]|uniref:DUF2267 domain-containing protein n=1 Tax=Caldovatus aquaticus TaxID=2865671 RepID=A0ABS7EYX0_9PROT|nr:DUF2267 domain-containing protein [Caldovatus aquaticus]MBW8267937.1 DUF2267 domain-containing protein [Caldovatus aquaticus]